MTVVRCTVLVGLHTAAAKLGRVKVTPDLIEGATHSER